MNPARSATLASLEAERVRPPRAYLDAFFEAIALELAGHFPQLDVEELEGDEHALP